MSERFDVAVVGGGPGGAAAALEAARRGLVVALFEPATGRRPKPCGEGLMPAGRDALVALGLVGALAQARPFGRLRYLVERRAPLEVTLPGTGLSLLRARLQAELEEALAAEPGVTRFAAVARAERAGSGFALRAGAARCTASVLVAADGLGGGTAPWLRGARGAVGSRIGARAHHAAAGDLDAVEVHLAGGLEVYLTPLPEDLVNVAVLADAAAFPGLDSGRLVAAALARAPRARARIGAPLGPAESRRLGARPPRRVAGGGAFLVGDAGGGVDPIVGCGTTVALRTGLLAARCAAELLGGAEPRRVARAYARAYASETRARRALARALHALAPRPAFAGAVVGAARRLPALTRLAARVAGGGREPLGAPAR